MGGADPTERVAYQATTSKVRFVCGVLAQDHMRAKARAGSHLT